MSSFIVQDATINVIVSHLFRDRDAGAIRRQLPPGDQMTPAELGEAMYKLNLAAVENRYGDLAAATMCDLSYRYHEVLDTRVRVIRALSCWLYQCSEGEVPNDPLYQLMAKYQGYLAMHFVRCLPEWDAAPWS